MSTPTRVSVNVQVDAVEAGYINVAVRTSPNWHEVTSGTITCSTPGDATVDTRVRVDSATNLGYVCARGTVQNFQNGDVIKGLIYPGAHTENDIDPSPPSQARTADVSNPNFSFTPGNDKELPGCAYANASPGATDTIAIWHMRGTNVHGLHVHQFRGIRSTLTECDTGGSGSSSVMMGPMHELIGKVLLIVRVPDGKYQGEYVAEWIGDLNWKFWVASNAYGIIANPSATEMQIEGPMGRERTTTIGRHPFSAEFSGKSFGTHKAVVVERKA
jgi:hypothetical protein